MNKEQIFTLLKQAYSQLGLGDAILMARAEMLESLGFVTEENASDVVAKQKGSLEQLQKSNDKRVTDALSAKTKELQAKYEKDLADALAKAKQAPEPPKQEPPAPQGLSQEVKDYLDKLASDRKSEYDSLLEQTKKDYEGRIKGLTDKLKVIEDENAAAKAAQAKADRIAKITTKAKELGIPQYRIEEGFNISDDADDNAIDSYLGTVAKNIKTNALPSNPHLLAGDGQASSEEIKALAASLVKNI